jgi:UDP:flavonoid glycosyltransferase YjiC (YdhE family)
MRALLTCVSGHSHGFNMVPLAAAVQRQGHEVTLSSAHEMAPIAAAAGVAFAPSGPGRLRLRTEMVRRYRHEGSAGTTDWSAGARIFGELAPRLRWRELSTVVDALRPDVIISEALEWAGPLVARLYKIPHYFHSIGPFHPDSIDLLWERARPLYRELLGPDALVGDVLSPYLDVCPPSVQTAAGRRLARATPVRLRAYHGDPATLNQPPPPAASTTGPARVLITFGTVSNAAVATMVESAIRLGACGFEVLVTLGPQGWFDWEASASRTGRRSGGSEVAPRVSVVDYVPLGRELPRTTVLVHHGGGNTLRAALEYGLPSLVIPQAPEQYRNARWVSEAGLGRMMLPADVTPERVADQVRALLNDAGVHTRLAAVRASWIAMPGPEQFFAELESGPAGPARAAMS